MLQTKPSQTGNRRWLSALIGLAMPLSTAILSLATFPSTVGAETLMTEMTQDQLKTRVAERYQAVFGALYVQSPLDHAYISLAAIPAKDFKIMGKTAKSWTVAHDLLVGVIVRATVSKADGLVQFDALSLAVE